MIHCLAMQILSETIALSDITVGRPWPHRTGERVSPALCANVRAVTGEVMMGSKLMLLDNIVQDGVIIGIGEFDPILRQFKLSRMQVLD
jgi:hypothetical protein